MAMLAITVSGWDEVGGTDEGEMEVEEGEEAVGGVVERSWKELVARGWFGHGQAGCCGEVAVAQPS